MRLHRLEMTAFGPFAHTVSIDYEKLNESGLFLLTGPTGSGKTTIFDAICFALYGKTSSARADLKSHFATPEAIPSVELECTISNTRLKIWRSPEWQNPQKKTKNHHRVHVQQFNTTTQQWDTLAERISDAATYITGLIGLDEKQFTQIMLLPQGEFAKFLNAKSAERETLLKKLFPIDTFEKVQELLKEQAQQANEHTTQITEQLRHLEEQFFNTYQRCRIEHLEEELNHAAQNLIDELPEEQHNTYLQQLKQLTQQHTPTTLKDDDTYTLDQRQEHMEQHHTIIQRVLPLVRQLHQNIAEELERNHEHKTQLQRRIEHHHHYTQLQEQQQQLTAQTSHINEQRQKVRRAQEAQQLLPLYRRFIETQQQQEHNTQQQQKLAHHIQQLCTEHHQHIHHNPQSIELPLITQLYEHPLEHNTNLKEYGEQLPHLLQTLHELTREEEQLNHAKKHYQQLLTRQKTLSTALEQNQQQHEKTQQRYEELNEQYQQLADTEEELIHAQQEYTHAQNILALSQEHEKEQQHLNKEQEHYKTYETQRRKDAQHLEKLQQLRYNQAAYSLAINLTPNEPCPVCGSCEHPAPAHHNTTEELVEQRDIDQAQQQLEHSTENTKNSHQNVQRITQHLEELTRNGALPIDQAHENLTAHREQQHQAEQRHHQRNTLKEQLNSLEHQLQELKEQAIQHHTSYEEHQKTLNEQHQHITTQENTLKQHHTNYTLNERIQNLNKLNSILDELKITRAHAQNISEQHQKNQDEWHQKLEESSFTSIQTIQDATIPTTQLQQWEEDITNHDANTHYITQALTHEHMVAVANELAQGHQPPSPKDLEHQQHKTKNLSTYKDVLLGQTLTLEQAQNTTTELLEQYREHRATCEELTSQAQMKQELAKIAHATSTDNTLKMQLTTYILAAQLEDITQAASEHLQAMTHGRYQLQHSDHKTQSKSGLGLAVYDHWHDRQRSPETLSGGETFMASLSLALGLADVVQHRHGGIEIDTLFVDEGFGTLDEDTLNNVMETLDGLREQGRVIGLISHVNELKTRIPEHITLVSSPEGSDIVTQIS
ncbi:AAA family ATPase [Rothia sp. P13129]|uniref:AAA family ATPase n=1 Tax=Rothia sp. P13129 TaxID=3402664 RepID=UPI003AD0DFBF